MANRNYNQFQGTLERGVVKLFLKAKFGVAGAVAKVERAHGIKSFTQDLEEGGYLIELGDASTGKKDVYSDFLALNGTLVPEELTAPAPITVLAGRPRPREGLINIGFLGLDAGAFDIVDPSADDIVYLEITLANTDAY